MLSRQTMWKTVVLVGFCAVGAYFLLPGESAKNVAFSVIGVASVVCVLVGIRVHRPPDRRGWYALAAGILLFVIGDAAFDIYPALMNGKTPFPSLADAFYLAGYPFVFAGVLLLTRDRTGASSREDVVDAAIVSVGALAVSWHFLMAPYVHDPATGIAGTFVNMTYPIMDLAVLFVVLKGLLFGTARYRVHSLLAIAFVFMLVTDFFYDLLTLHGSYATGNIVDAGWLVNYVLVAAAALHPSMALAVPSRAAGRVTSGRRLPMVAFFGFVSVLSLLIVTSRGVRTDVALLAMTSVVLFGLVAVRIRWMVARIVEQASLLEHSLSVRDLLEEDLRHQAFHDSLTGLANRSLLYDRTEHALAASGRSAGTVAVCFCDVDGFKTVNDGLGHAAGDEILVTVGKRLVSVVRPGDTVARLGGDEFAVLLEDVHSPAVVDRVAERMVSAVRRPIEIRGTTVDLSLSVGIALAGGNLDAEELLTRADSAMYEAKASGKDRYEVFEPSMHSRIAERLEIVSSFGRALANSELFLVYQPQFSLADGHLEGFAALVRWRHPTLGVLTPDRFMSLAEEMGYIVPIGSWMLETACEHAVRWSSSRMPLSMSVTVSARQLRHPGLADDVGATLARSGFPPGQLVLEITEAVLVREADHAEQVLRALKALGVRLAIDDFGTACSSLGYLRRLPVDFLKIDKTYVDPLADPAGEGAAFVRTIVKLAEGLGLQTVAEGIQCTEQRALLGRLGCDSVRGYLVGGPLSDVAAAGLVDTGGARTGVLEPATPVGAGRRP